MKFFFLLGFCCSITCSFSQTSWENVDREYGSMPPSMHVFRSTSPIEGKPSIAYYVRVSLSDRNLLFTTDSSYKRRLTPAQFYAKNNKPLLVVNGTFFDFASNRNLNLLIRNGKLIAYNVHEVPLKGNDSGSSFKVTRSALGIRKNRTADIAWIYSDSGKRKPYAYQQQPIPWKDNSHEYSKKDFDDHYRQKGRKWKMMSAIGGGPVLIQDGKSMITNDEERMFTGKARHDRHPRTAIGYTINGDLIILVVEGRNAGIAEGASLEHLANMFLELGCTEALNLDGGGSSCLLINGKETIKPSDKEGERPVPGVFLVKAK